MTSLDLWSKKKFAILHGNDVDGRLEAINKWKSINIDCEWEEFICTICNDDCSWSEVLCAINSPKYLGLDRIIIVPQADDLLVNINSLPIEIKNILNIPIPCIRLLLVVNSALDDAMIFNTDLFTMWRKNGNVFRVGVVNNYDLVEWINNLAKSMNLRLNIGVANKIIHLFGHDIGAIRRKLEFLDLISNNGLITLDHINESASEPEEQCDLFAWIKACQMGHIDKGLYKLKQILDSDLSKDCCLRLLSQARREVERLYVFMHIGNSCIKSNNKALLLLLQLNQRQEFLLVNYGRIADKIGFNGLVMLLRLINQTDVDIKGQAIAKSITSLINLTIVLCHVWRP